MEVEWYWSRLCIGAVRGSCAQRITRDCHLRCDPDNPVLAAALASVGIEGEDDEDEEEEFEDDEP